MKSGDTFRYPQYTFWTLRTHRKLQKSKPCKFVKSKENLGISKILKKFTFFDYRKVHFPASKSTSECFLYPPNLSRSVKRSLKILLDTHKMIFGHLDQIVETIRKRYQSEHIARLFVHFSKELCYKIQ